MRSRPGLRAFTLLEVLVAMAVMAILTTILLRLGSVAYRVGREEIERSAQEGQLLLTTRRMEEDLLVTTPAGISLSADGRVLVIHPVEEVLGTGQVVYQDKLIHWSWDEAAKRLTSRELDSATAGVSFDGGAKRLTPAQLLALPLAAEDHARLRLERVTKFSVADPLGVVPPLVGSPLQLDIEVELGVAQTRKLLQHSKTFHLRTGGAL